MSARRGWTRLQAARALLGKLVIAISVFVALASSPPPRWVAWDEAQLQLVFDERGERKALFSVELAGNRYADAVSATLEIIVMADRTASDLELTVSPPEPGPDGAAETEALTETEADFRAGFDPDTDVPTARADVRSPNVVSLSVPLKCVEHDPAVPRAESCFEQLEITLARESERPLSVELSVRVEIVGSKPKQPDGTFEIGLEELAP